MKIISQELLDRAEEVIPKGHYCYTIIGEWKNNCIPISTCPFWECFNDKPEMESGYCHYLKHGDWEDSLQGILWDQCKECRINEDE
jgi:hypothetical protein